MWYCSIVEAGNDMITIKLFSSTNEPLLEFLVFVMCIGHNYECYSTLLSGCGP